MGRSASRSGSLIVVIMVVAVLGVLAGVSILMSSSFSRASSHEKLVWDAKSLARAAVEEAAVLVNNGKATAQIAEAVSRKDAVEVILPQIAGTPTSAVPAELRPRVYLKATLVNQDSWKDTAQNQYEGIKKILLPINDPAVQAFLKRMVGDHKDYGGEGLVTVDTTTGAKEWKAGALDNAQAGERFWNGWVKAVGVTKWAPEVREDKDRKQQIGTGQNGQPTYATYFYRKDQMAELQTVFEMFYNVGAPSQPLPGFYTSKPSIPTSPKGVKVDTGLFKASWEKAVRAVAKDAARKVQACGGNPSLAMAHLVGDLKVGESVGSGAEVQATSDFMMDTRIGASKTYLLEITATAGYEGAGKRMAGTTASRTYRILQRCEWELAMAEMARSLAADLMSTGGIGADDLSRLYRPESGVEGRNEDLAGPGIAKWDPKKFLDDIVYTELPSTVGSRLYPYGVGSVHWNAKDAAGTDASGE